MSGVRGAFATLTQEEQAERDVYKNPKAVVELRTKDMAVWSISGDYQELKFTDKKSAAGGLTMLLPVDDHYADYFDGQPKATVRPIVVRLPGYTTLWFITKFTRARKGLKRYYEVEAVGALEHLSWIRLWPCPWLPAEFQPIKYWFGTGPSATMCALPLAANLVRLQGNLFSIPTGNLFAPDTWNIVKNAMHPMMVNPRNKVLGDTTKWDFASWRMDEALTAFTEVAQANDLQIVYQFFDPDVDEQPFPEFIHLDRPKLIFDFVEKGQPVGWTGTLLDGFFRTGIEMGTDLLGWVLYPILGDDRYQEYLDKVQGTIANKPIAVYTTGKYSPADEYEQTTHLAMASRVTAGGKSPEWVNTLLVTGANMLLSAAGAAIGVALVAATGGAAAPLLPFLSNLQLGAFEGVVKDTIMAFHTSEDIQRANEAGPWRFRETFAESSSTGLSMETLSGMKSAHWATRPYISHAISVQNGTPYYIGKDLQLGDLVGVQMADGRVEVEYLEEITYEDSRGARGKLTLQIGRPDAEREPGSIALGKIRRFGTWLTRAALSE
ncbi:minor tail protein [Gordonia phage William]|uniref:Minor tail protein n=1 Tax=Gordonia phage William TaxID=2571253 RepID=A0A4Y6EQ31_9CAUD|nr:minor tail protein [Gordonia phage William]QDF17114.1 minor tail protein [Gordonia phage William]